MKAWCNMVESQGCGANSQLDWVCWAPPQIFHQGYDEGKIAQLLCREGDEDKSNVAMVALNKCIFGNQAPRIEQGVNSLCSNTCQIAHVGLVLKDGMEWAPWPSMCKISVKCWLWSPWTRSLLGSWSFCVDWNLGFGRSSIKGLNISKTCQSLMKMVECMEDENPPCHKGETRSGVT